MDKRLTKDAKIQRIFHLKVKVCLYLCFFIQKSALLHEIGYHIHCFSFLFVNDVAVNVFIPPTALNLTCINILRAVLFPVYAYIHIMATSLTRGCMQQNIVTCL